MKSCVLFVVLFLSGVGLFVGGFVYDVMSGGLSIQDSPSQPDPQALEHRNRARYLEVGGIAIVFGTVFAAAGWAFYKRERGESELDAAAHTSRPNLTIASTDSLERDRDRRHEDR